MEVQAKLQIGDNDSQIYSKQYNVVNLTCHYTRLTSSSRPNTDALCEHIALTLVAPNMEESLKMPTAMLSRRNTESTL